LAESLAGSGDWEAAVAQFLEVLKRDAENPAALLGLASYHHRKEEYDEAVRLLEQAVRRAPDSVPILEKLAQSYEAAGYPEEADEVRARLDELR
jgi:tetratricopeptide (TPR) repeat protein